MQGKNLKVGIREIKKKREKGKRYLERDRYRRRKKKERKREQ